MGKIKTVILLLLLSTVAYSQGVQKQVLGKITSSVYLSGAIQAAFSSDYGYSVDSIAVGDRYAVRSGTNIVEYEIDSISFSGLITGFNIKLFVTALNGFGGSFPTATAEIYRPTTNLGLSLMDPSLPDFTQWGLVNRNMILLDSVLGTTSESLDWAIGGNTLSGNGVFGSNSNHDVGVETRDTVRLTFESDGDIRASTATKVIYLNSATSFSAGVTNTSLVFANNTIAYIGLLDGSNGLFETIKTDTSANIAGRYLNHRGILNTKVLESRLYDLNHSNYIALRPRDTIAANFTLYWPNAAPVSNGQVMKGNTNGQMYFDDVEAAVQPDTTYTLTVGSSTLKITGSDSITASISSGHITVVVPEGKHITHFSSFLENTDLNYTDGTFCVSAGLRVTINNSANQSIVVERPLRAWKKLFTGGVSTSNPLQAQTGESLNEIIYSNTSGSFSFAYNDLKANAPNGIVVSF